MRLLRLERATRPIGAVKPSKREFAYFRFTVGGVTHYRSPLGPAPYAQPAATRRRESRVARSATGEAQRSRLALGAAEDLCTIGIGAGPDRDHLWRIQ